MTSVILAVFLAAHGAVHGIMFGLPLVPAARADMPFDPSDSWLLGETRTAAFVFALGVTGAFVAAGLARLWGAGWWPAAVIAASLLSLVLLTLYASKWFILGYPIDVALLYLAWTARQSASG